MPGARTRSAQGDWDEAHLINAAADIHADDPAFGYQFIADELPARGTTAGENRWRGCARDSGSGPRSARSAGLTPQGRTARRTTIWPPASSPRPAGPDLADRHHRAPDRRRQAVSLRDQGRVLRPDRRLLDETPRMTAGLAVSALPDANALRDASRHVVVEFATVAAQVPVRSVRPDTCEPRPHRIAWAEPGPAATTPPWNRSSPCSRRTSWIASAGQRGNNCAWRSSPGSNAPTTAEDASDGSAASHPSNTRQSTRPHTRA